MSSSERMSKEDIEALCKEALVELCRASFEGELADSDAIFRLRALRDELWSGYQLDKVIEQYGPEVMAALVTLGTQLDNAIAESNKDKTEGYVSPPVASPPTSKKKDSD